MLTILIVEDELPIASMYEFKLQQAGYRVKSAHNGIEGLKLAEEFHPELILLDLKMPVMSGDEMLVRLRGQEWGNKLRIVILTNISKDEAPSKLRFLAVDRYIVKAHSTPGQVVSIVNELLA